jgi:hypothetical protein
MGPLVTSVRQMDHRKRSICKFPLLCLQFVFAHPVSCFSVCKCRVKHYIYFKLLYVEYAASHVTYFSGVGICIEVPMSYTIKL